MFPDSSKKHVADQDPDEPKAADQRGGSSHEESRQAVRDCLLQEQSPLLAVRTLSSHRSGSEICAFWIRPLILHESPDKKGMFLASDSHLWIDSNLFNSESDVDTAKKVRLREEGWDPFSFVTFTEEKII